MFSRVSTIPYVLLVIFHVVQLGATQNFAGEPACAIPCLSSAFSSAGCSPTDQACYCGPSQSIIGSYALQCLVASCSAADIFGVQSVGAFFCSQYSGGLGAASEPSIFTATQTATVTSSRSAASEPSIFTATQTATVTSSQSAAAGGSVGIVTSQTSNSASSPSPSRTTVTPVTTNNSPPSSTGTVGPATVTLSPATVTLSSISQSAGGGATGVSGATSGSGSTLGGGAIAGIAIGAVVGIVIIVALIWILFYRRRRTRAGVASGTGGTQETPELGGKEKATPQELHGQHLPAELSSQGGLPAELGPGGGWPDHEREMGND